MTDIPLTVSDDVIRLNPGLADLKPVSASKYHNAKAEAAGLSFQSGHEASVVSGLILLEKQREIFALRLQVRFPLPGGIIYIADAVYLDMELKSHIIDAKGFRTREYRNKKKLFESAYPAKVEEL